MVLKTMMNQDSDGEKISGNISKVFYSLSKGRWKHIQAESYKKDTSSYQGMSRYELVGKRGESLLFHTRYFEIEKGGFSTYERHDHEHVVMVVRGSGEVKLGCRHLNLAEGDVVYVRPGDGHQFLNRTSDEPFGFICIVNAERDRPVAIDGQESCAICE